MQDQFIKLEIKWRHIQNLEISNFINTLMEISNLEITFLKIAI
jgi:hypothetical protein